MKPEVEDVIRLGRREVEEKTVPNPVQMTARIDSLKALYNKVYIEIIIDIMQSYC